MDYLILLLAAFLIPLAMYGGASLALFVTYYAEDRRDAKRRATENTPEKLAEREKKIEEWVNLRYRDKPKIKEPKTQNDKFMPMATVIEF